MKEFIIANWNLIMVRLIKSRLPLRIKVAAFNALTGERG